MLAAEPRASKEDSFSPQTLNTMFRGLAGEPGVAVAISGGSDSTALLHLLLSWRDLVGVELRVVALTVDHGLRAESATEAKKVARSCQKLGVEHHTLPWTGEKPLTGIQAKARTARYDLMTGWCRKNGISILLTGHTADDQAETVLMRARRTNSLESLAAIWPQNEWAGVRIVRPLLNSRRGDLRRYLMGKNIPWLEDPSNRNTQFERVRVRQALDESQVPSLAAQARDAQLRSKNLADDAARRFRLLSNANIPGALSLPLSVFRKDSPEHRVLYLREMFRRFRQDSLPERSELQRLASWVVEGKDARRTLGRLLFFRHGSQLVVGREPGRIDPAWQELPESGTLNWDGRFQIEGPPGLKVGPVLLAPDLPRPTGLPHWLWLGLPAVALPDGRHLLAFTIPDAIRGKDLDQAGELLRKKELERLGIRATATYVNKLDVVRLAQQG